MSVGADISLKDYLKKYFGFDAFKGNQEVVIRNVLDGNDSFVLMPTGGGKSLMLSITIFNYGRNSNCNFSINCINEKSG